MQGFRFQGFRENLGAGVAGCHRLAVRGVRGAGEPVAEPLHRLHRVRPAGGRLHGRRRARGDPAVPCEAQMRLDCAALSAALLPQGPPSAPYARRSVLGSRVLGRCGAVSFAASMGLGETEQAATAATGRSHLYLQVEPLLSPLHSGGGAGSSHLQCEPNRLLLPQQWGGPHLCFPMKPPYSGGGAGSSHP